MDRSQHCRFSFSNILFSISIESNVIWKVLHTEKKSWFFEKIKVAPWVVVSGKQIICSLFTKYSILFFIYLHLHLIHVNVAKHSESSIRFFFICWTGWVAWLFVNKQFENSIFQIGSLPVQEDDSKKIRFLCPTGSNIMSSFPNVKHSEYKSLKRVVCQHFYFDACLKVPKTS